MAPRGEKREIDGVKYTKAEFVDYYGEKKGSKKWDDAAPRQDKACTVCGKTNHTKADCKHKDKECSICGKTGHLAAMCRQAEGGGGAGKAAKKSESVSTKACSVCGKTNHLKADCKLKDAECKICGKIGHIAKVCRAPGGGAEKAEKGATKEKRERPARPPRQLATEGEIPVKRVARVYRAKVTDEAAALKLDALMNDVHTKLTANKAEGAKGYMKMTRTLCKTEWAYEASIVWRTIEDFTAYKGSELRKEVTLPLEEKVKEIITGDLYSGVRVFDEL